MVNENVILSQNGVIRKDGTSFINPLTVTIMTKPTDELVLTKALQTIPVPKSTKNQESDTSDPNYGNNDLKIIDILNKVEERVSIDGSLINGTISGDSSTTAIGRKRDLIKIVKGGGIFNMTYEGETFTINIDNLSIKNISGTINNDEFVEQYIVKFTGLKGVNF